MSAYMCVCDIVSNIRSNLIKQFQLSWDGVQVHIIDLHLFINSTVPSVLHYKFIPLCLGLKELSMLPDYMQPIIFLEVGVVNHFVYKLNLNIDTIISALLSKLVQVAYCAIMELRRFGRQVLFFLHIVLLASPIYIVFCSLCILFLLLKDRLYSCSIFI